MKGKKQFNDFTFNLKEKHKNDKSFTNYVTLLKRFYCHSHKYHVAF